MLKKCRRWGKICKFDIKWGKFVNLILNGKKFVNLISYGKNMSFSWFSLFSLLTFHLPFAIYFPLASYFGKFIPLIQVL